MSDTIEFWDSMASFLETSGKVFLDVESLDQLYDIISDPVLIVGAGNGLLVEPLRNKGYNVDGVDISPKMVEYAEKLRGIKLTLADGAHMPFDDNAYNTSIIATGVLDFLDDDKKALEIIKETKRVTRDSGVILAAFYRYHPRIEEFMRYVGLISKNDEWLLRESFKSSTLSGGEYFSYLRQNLDVSLVGTVMSMIKVMMFLPKKEKVAMKAIKVAWDKFKKEVDAPYSYIECLPERVPYRNEKQIKKLLSDIGFPIKEFRTLYGCFVARL